MRRRYRKTRKERRKQRKIIMLSIIGLFFVMSAGYAAFQTNLNINAKGTFIERSRTIQSWTETSNEDFHTDFYKKNIVSATFLDTNKVPSNRVDFWDVSVSKDKGVMAWVTESSTETGKYDLFIGANNGVIANEDSSNLFRNFTGLISIDFKNNFDTSNTINMARMFEFCTSINQIDLSSFNTKNVNNMDFMFKFLDNGVSLENNLSKIIFGDKWSMSNVKSISHMFASCNKLTELDVSNWDTSNIEDMTSAFAYCSGLKKIDVSKWNTGNVKLMNFLFHSCKSLTEINVSNWDTRNVTGMWQMFIGCSGLKELNLCSFNTSKVTTMQRMFDSTTSLTKVKVGPNWTTANADTANMFLNSGILSVTTGQC